MQQQSVKVHSAMATPPPLDALVETARLAALQTYRVLDVADLAGLSRLAEQAAAGLGATHAAVSFVDATRVWFGGAFGFDMADIAREGSFCNAVIRSGAPLLVSDAYDDPRFWDHELVRTDSGARCYAGAPVIDEGGYRIGTVAVFSSVPSAFDRSILADLVALAQIVRDFLAESRAARAANGAVVQGWLGVRTLGSQQALPAAAGLIVLSVARGSPAQRSGLRAADLLHSIDGRVLRTSSDIVDALAGRVHGAWVPIRFRRAGLWQDGTIQVRARLDSRS